MIQIEKWPTSIGMGKQLEQTGLIIASIPINFVFFYIVWLGPFEHDQISIGMRGSESQYLSNLFTWRWFRWFLFDNWFLNLFRLFRFFMLCNNGSFWGWFDLNLWCLDFKNGWIRQQTHLLISIDSLNSGCEEASLHVCRCFQLVRG